MSKERNHLPAPRNVLNTKRLYTIYMLKELNEGNNFYGKEIYDNLHEYFSSYHIPISYSTIYNTLHDMEEKGYVTSQWDANTSLNNRTKRFYKITDYGVKYFNTVYPDIVNTLNNNKNLIQRFIELLS